MSRADDPPTAWLERAWSHDAASIVLRSRYSVAERAPGVLRLRVYIIKTSFRFRYSFATYTQLPVVPGSNEALKRYEATGLSVKARWLIEYGCCKGVQGPSSGLKFHLCVRRSGVLGCRNENFACENDMVDRANFLQDNFLMHHERRGRQRAESRKDVFADSASGNCLLLRLRRLRLPKQLGDGG